MPKLMSLDVVVKVQMNGRAPLGFEDALTANLNAAVRETQAQFGLLSTAEAAFQPFGDGPRERACVYSLDDLRQALVGDPPKENVMEAMRKARVVMSPEMQEADKQAEDLALTLFAKNVGVSRERLVQMLESEELPEEFKDDAGQERLKEGIMKTAVEIIALRKPEGDDHAANS